MRSNAITFIGPSPPPFHGQAIATEFLAKVLRDRSVDIQIVDSEGGALPVPPVLRKFAGHAMAGIALLSGRTPVYISANSNAGLWMTVALVALARLRSRSLIIHHHSYARCRTRESAMVALARLGGRSAIQLVLCERMAEELIRQVPEVAATAVLNNSLLIDHTLRNIERPARNGRTVTFGHMSNLTLEKGIGDFTEAAIIAAGRSEHLRFLVAGPCKDSNVRRALNRAERELGGRYCYMGPVYGERKLEFFSAIDGFVFPTRYKNEAQPLVLYEAMAAGAMCIATNRSCIAGDIDGAGIAINENEMTPSVLADYMIGVASQIAADPCGTVQRSRERFESHLSNATSEIDQIIKMLSC